MWTAFGETTARLFHRLSAKAKRIVVQARQAAQEKQWSVVCGQWSVKSSRFQLTTDHRPLTTILSFLRWRKTAQLYSARRSLPGRRFRQRAALDRTGTCAPH